MQSICFAICLLLFLFSSFRKKIYDPAFIMYGIWSAILFFNLLGAYGINKASSKAYYYVFIGLISFFIGIIIQTIVCTDRIYFKIAQFTINKEKEINYRLIYILSGIVLVLNLIDFLIAVSYLFKGMSYSQIRSWKMEIFEDATNPISGRRSFLEQTFRVIFVEPFATALAPIAVIDFFKKGGKKSNLLVITILNMVLGTISGGGSRLGVITLILMLTIVGAIYKEESKNIVKKMKKKIIVLIIAGIGSIVFFTSQRTRASVFEESYYYIALCIPLFDYWIPTIESGAHTNGMMILHGITRIPCMIFEKVGFGNGELYHLARDYILSANSFRSVGARGANSFVTPFYYLYLDFGIFGIMLGMFLLGYSAEKYYKRICKDMKTQELFIYLLILRGIIFTFIRWDFISTNYVLAYFFVVIFFKKKKSIL